MKFLIKTQLLFLFVLFLAAPGFGAETPVETRKFWVWDLSVMPPGFRQPEFTLARKGVLENEDEVFIWVEKDLGDDQPSEEALDTLFEQLMTKTPDLSLDKKKGAIELLREHFGRQPTPPSTDRSIHFVIAAIKPYIKKNGTKIGHDGYFNGFDQLTEAEAQALDDPQHSNENNIIYINALEDFDSDYMRAVVFHELCHLLTFNAKDSLSNWINEMMGEIAMQLTGYFTDTAHVDKYRANPAWPIAVEDPDLKAGVKYLLSYGAVAAFGEYLYSHFPAERLRKLSPDVMLPQPSPVPGAPEEPKKPTQAEIDFGRIDVAFEKSFQEIFEGYVSWLYEQDPKSHYEGKTAVPRVLVDLSKEKLKVATTGVLYLENELKADELEIETVPQNCTSSQNVLRTKSLIRTVDKTEEKATAVWVESTPPCLAIHGREDFENDAFVIKTK